MCTGRFHDFRERRACDRGLCLRQPIYEKDRMDPVDPAAQVDLAPDVLARFPERYRHLAYPQSSIGYPVKTDMPGLKGDKVDTLYRTGADWLAGRGIEWESHRWGG